MENELLPSDLNRLAGVVVERPPRVREVVVSMPVRVLPNTLKLVIMVALHGARGCRVSIMTDWLVFG